MNIDSDEAAKYVKKPTGFLDTEHPDRCSFDHVSLTTAFATHREQATRELIEALQWCVDHFDGNTRCNADQETNCIEMCRLALTKATTND